VYLSGVHRAGIAQGVPLRWCIPGYNSGVYLSGGVYPGIYLPMYTPGYVPPYVHPVYTPCTTLGIPPYLTVTAVHGLSMQSWVGREALGSRKRNPLGGRPLSLSGPQECDEEREASAHCCSAPPAGMLGKIG